MADKKEGEETPVHILIVEDSATQAEQLRYILEQHGYDATVARNGREALEAIQRQIPTLIISDVVMPEMDGYDLCHRIKSDENLQRIPVILLTALSDPIDVIRGLECGADFFLVKPCNEKYLLSRIAMILANRNMNQSEVARMGVEIVFEGRKHFITSDRLQILNLLLSSYESAVQKNRELIETQAELQRLNEQLEEKVRERTAALEAEIEEHRLSEEALRQAEEKYRSIFENAVEGLFLMSPNEKFLEVNAAMVHMLGYASKDELMDIDPTTQLYADPRTRIEMLDQLQKTGHIDGAEVEWKRKDGERITVRLGGSVLRNTRGDAIGFEGSAHDITEQRALEAQLRQAQKMEAIGLLADGVAHDFNNMLSVIMGYSEILQMDAEAGSKTAECAEEIEKAAQRAAGLTRQLLVFSRRQVFQPEILDLNAVVGETEKMLRRLIGENIELRCVLDPGLARVKADPGQIEQVIMNMAINARDAMPKGGTLVIETANVELDDTYARQHASVAPGPYVMLAVSDTGRGMDAEIQSRIFEPFFTTKEKGEGTGLGLSTVYGIVRQSGGTIWVYSEVGKGTTFKVYLPQTREKRRPERRTPRSAGSSAGSETILLVEDEESIRKLTQQALERQGYTVLTAANGQEALEAANRHEGTIHLVISDVVLPVMGGPEMAMRLRETRSETKVMFISGYTDNTIAHHGVLETATLVQKPFTPLALVNKVREVLEG